MDVIALDPEIREALYKIGLKELASDGDAIRFWASLEGKARTEIDELGVQFGVAVDNDALEILGAAQHSGLPDSFGVERVLNNVPLATALKETGKARAATRKPIAIGNPIDNSGGPTSFADAIAIRVSDGKPLRDAKGNEVKPHGHSVQLAGMPMIEIGKRYLSSQGVPVETLNRSDLQKLLWNGRGAMGMHSTSDFPGVLANSLNKVAMRQYMEYQPSWQKFCKRGVLNDFKTASRLNLGEVPNLARVYEGGEYTQFTIGERKESITMIKFGKAFSITWEALVNDDLSLFDRLPGQIMQAARRLEDAQAIGQLTNGTSTSAPYAMGDGYALFDSTHHTNLETTTAAVGAPSVAAFNSMRKSMRLQTGISADAILNLEPYCVIVPAALESTAEKVLTSEDDPGTTTARVRNIWQNKLQLVVSPLLDASSATAWYGSVDPNLHDTIEVAFLQGYEQPTFMQLDQLSPDRRDYYIRHCVAAKALDYRGLWKNSG